MSGGYSTRWSVIHGAAQGNKSDRDEFARRYEGVVHAYLGARWRESPMLQDVDDAVQEVFVNCFREGGVLARVERDRPGGFRAYFFAAIRNVARVFERKHGRERVSPAPTSSAMDRVPADDESIGSALDRAWAQALVNEAREYQAEWARDQGPDAQQRVELLHLRFGEGMPIRDIARLWEAEPAHVHHEYAKARKEFKTALLEVTAFHHPGSQEEVELECARLLEIVD